MKKIDFMSPEALLQVEIFKEGEDSPTPTPTPTPTQSSIVDLSNNISFQTSGETKSIKKKYYGSNLQSPTKVDGIFYIEFTPLFSTQYNIIFSDIYIDGYYQIINATKESQTNTSITINCTENKQVIISGYRISSK